MLLYSVLGYSSPPTGRHHRVSLSAQSVFILPDSRNSQSHPLTVVVDNSSDGLWPVTLSIFDSYEWLSNRTMYERLSSGQQ